MQDLLMAMMPTNMHCPNLLILLQQLYLLYVDEGVKQNFIALHNHLLLVYVLGPLYCCYIY